LSLLADRSDAPPSPLLGRIEEGGRTVLRDYEEAAHGTISSVRATPHP
jgi:hypothetical protein